MTKILSQAGNSLADVYDVEGSIAGIDQLETRELPIMHEMGATIFSERFGGVLVSATSAAVNQSTAWNIGLVGLPAHVWRVFGIQVFVNATARVDFCSICVRETVSGREMPIWAWDSAADSEYNVRFSDDGGAIATTIFLQPAAANKQLPHLMAGAGQPQAVAQLVFRGISSAFGAGTVTADVLTHVGFPDVAGLSSRGLPIPSW